MLRTTLLAAAVSAAALAVPGVASAAQKSAGAELSLASPAVELPAYKIAGKDPTGIADIDLDVSAKASWSAKQLVSIGWESANVRQGTPLKVSRNVLPLPGSVKVTWHVQGGMKIWSPLWTDFTHEDISATAACLPLTTGEHYDCLAVSEPMTVFRAPTPFSPYFKLTLRARFTITPEGQIVQREWRLPDGAGAIHARDVGLVAQSETIIPSCSSGVGLPLSYRLGDVVHDPAITVRQQAYLEAGWTDPTGITELPAHHSGPVGPATKSTLSMPLKGSAAGAKFALGDLQANQTPPGIGYMSFTAKAGEAFRLTPGEVTSNCTLKDFEWTFSDGSKEYGPWPWHTFAKPGIYSGKLTLADHNGLTASRPFNVTVTP